MNVNEALKILGLNENCTKDDIKKAYRKAAKQHHPDLGGSNNNMELINLAKSTLDEWVETRATYTSSNNNYNNPRKNRYTGYYNEYNDKPKQDYNVNYNYKYGTRTDSSSTTGTYKDNRIPDLSLRQKLEGTFKLINDQRIRDSFKYRVLKILIAFVICIIAPASIIVYCLGFFGKDSIIFYLISIITITQCIAKFISLRSKIVNSIQAQPIELHFRNYEGGIAVTITCNYHSYGTYKVMSNTNLDYWDLTLQIWKRAIDGGNAVMMVDNIPSKLKHGNILPQGGIANKAYVFHSNLDMVYFDLNVNNEYMYIVPGLFILVTAGGIRVIPMESMKLEVENSNYFGKHKAKFTSDYKITFELEYNCNILNWDYLILH